MNNTLAYISVTGFVVVSILAFLAAKFGVEWAKAMMDTILPMIVQCWIINFTTVMNFHYGTSAGSQRKTNIIADLVKPKDECIELTNEVK